MHRRHFLQTSLLASLATMPALADGTRAPRILLRSSWQTINIGDIGHTPGVLALIEKHLPNAEVRLWPGDETQTALGKGMLFDKLPEDVKAKTVWRENFWLTDEALSIYVRSAGLFGNEMHSPIMCIGNGIPAIVCRWHQQTSKGIMWRDIGLGEWLFDFDNEDEVQRMPAAVLAMAKDPASARIKAAAARDRVRQLHQESMLRIGKETGV